MPAQGHILLCNRQLLARGHAQLQFDEVETRDCLCYRMLDLQARIYFKKVKIAIRIHQELSCPRVRIARFARQANRSLAHRSAQFRRHKWRWRFFDHLLVPPLHRTFALAEVNDVPMCVGEDLHLDMPGPVEIFLDVNALIAKGVERFGSCIAPRRGEFMGASHHAHALAAASRNGFQQYGVPDLIGNAARCFELRDWFANARNHRHTGAKSKFAGGRLCAKALHRLGRRPDKGDACIGAGAWQFGIFREETVPGMKRVASGSQRDIHELIDAQIAFARRRRPDRVGFVGHAHVQRGAIDVAVNGYTGDAEIAASAQNAHRNFPAISNEQLFEHDPAAERACILALQQQFTQAWECADRGKSYG